MIRTHNGPEVLVLFLRVNFLTLMELRNLSYQQVFSFKTGL